MLKSNLGDAPIALEFFANLLVLKGIIDVQTEEEILNASSVEDLDAITDRLALEVSGDY